MPGAKRNQPPPAFYVAAQDIYSGHPESGTMPVLAYVKGARVPVDVVDHNNLYDQVVRPEDQGSIPASSDSSAAPTVPPQYDTSPAEGADADESAGKE